MSRKFSPLSTAVALATAGMIVTVAGCAMGTRSNDSTDTAGLSRESIQNSQLPNVENVPPGPGTQTADASATSPGQWTQPAPVAAAMQNNDTAAIPRGDQSAPVANDAYPSGTSTSVSSTPSTAYTPSTTGSASTMPNTSSTVSTTANTASTMSSSSDMSSTTTANNAGQTLPPRSDRN